MGVKIHNPCFVDLNLYFKIQPADTRWCHIRETSLTEDKLYFALFHPLLTVSLAYQANVHDDLHTHDTNGYRWL